MASTKILFILLLTLTILILTNISDVNGSAEFHLSCTILVDGSSIEEKLEDDNSDGDFEPNMARGKGGKGTRNKGGGRPVNKGKYKVREKRSARDKRAANKVQLLCDIDNPKGREIAMRTYNNKG